MKQFRLLVLSVLLLIATASFCQYGTLDSEFSDDGKVITAFDEFHSSVRSIVVQPDGKLIAAGNMFATDVPFSQFALARYNSDGSLDETFGTKGKLVESSAMQMFLHSVALQSGEKIVVAGVEFPNRNKTAESVLKRYNPDGTQDFSFGINGEVIAPLLYSTSMTIQEDGKIILAGYSLRNVFKPNNYDLVLMRFNRSGTLDEEFGFNGIVSIRIRGLGPQISVAVQSDKKIVVAADAIGVDDRDMIVLRFLPDGSTDKEFGNNGTARVFAKNDNAAEAVKIQALDEKILVAGTSLPSLSSSFMLARLLPNGDLDSDFGDHGVAIAALETTEQLKSIAIQPDGMIVASGMFLNEKSSEDIILKRYLSNGELDPSFGNNGIVITEFELRSQAAAMELQADGKIIVGGYSGGSKKVDFALLRYISGVKIEEGLTDEQNSYSVSPNPVNKTVNLGFNLKQAQGLTVDLYDFNGRKIQNVLQRKEFPAGANSYTIDLPENLTKGIYFLNISNGKSISNVKIVK